MQPAYDQRREWADRRQLGERVAVFHEGEAVRCPATRRSGGGLNIMCGHGRDVVAKGTKVTVLAERRAVDRATGALNRICEKCKAKLRVEVEFLTQAADRAA